MSVLKMRACQLLWTGAAAIIAAAPALVRAQSGFRETFSTDPLVSQRWTLMTSDDPDRFVYESATGTLKALYNAGRPTARLVRPLGRTLNQDDSFLSNVRFKIRSQGFFAHPIFFAELSFGFLNLQATGPDRVGYSSSPKAYDLLSFDYFPASEDSGIAPSLMTTIIRRPGQSFFSSIDFVSGSETELAEPGENDLPRDVMLVAEIRYRGDTRRSTLRILRDGVPLAINLPAGGVDGDPTTITTQLNGSGFDVNAFGLLLWKDTFTNASTVIATLDFDEVEVVAPEFGDFDRDADVDAADWTFFSSCGSGPAVPFMQGCDACDRDRDGDVDAIDFAAFQRNMSGPR